MATAMAPAKAPATTTAMRRTGVDVVGDMPWGTHFCLFYDTKADLLEILVAYCKAGLESEEFCLWVVAAPLTQEDARQALGRAIPDFHRYVADGSIETVSAHDWYLQDGRFDLKRVIDGWNEKLARASARGYAGVRVTGDTAWLQKNDWKDFLEYEESLNGSIANQRMTVLCTYPLHACGADEIRAAEATAAVRRRVERGHRTNDMLLGSGCDIDLQQPASACDRPRDESAASEDGRGNTFWCRGDLAPVTSVRSYGEDLRIVGRVRTGEEQNASSVIADSGSIVDAAWRANACGGELGSDLPHAEI